MLALWAGMRIAEHKRNAVIACPPNSLTLARKHQSKVEFLHANGGCAASSMVRCMFVRTAV